MTAQDRSARSEGFTLIELLVVIAIIVTMAALLIGGLRGTGKSANLQAAQNMISNVLTVARAKAISSQRRTRIIFQTDAGAGQPSERFLHFFALQQLPDALDDPKGSTWVTIKRYALPDEVYVLPVDLDQFPGLISTSGSSDETNWMYSDGSKKMGSRLFYGNSVRFDLKGGQLESLYQGVMFTARGTIARLDGTGGFPNYYTADIVVATGRLQSPDVVAGGGSPIVLINANSVRAVQVSTYGVPMLVNNREDFK